MNVEEAVLFSAFASEGEALVFAKNVVGQKVGVVTVYIGGGAILPRKDQKPVCYLVLPLKAIRAL